MKMKTFVCILQFKERKINQSWKNLTRIDFYFPQWKFGRTSLNKWWCIMWQLHKNSLKSCKQFSCRKRNAFVSLDKRATSDETGRFYQSYMTVVPCVVINQCGSVGHAGYLVSVVPPRHHACVLVCVLSQPIISLSEVVKDITSPNGKKENQ